MFPGRRRGGGGGRGNLGVMLLAFQLFNFGFERIPPVTLVAILGQVAIFLGVGDLGRWFPSTYDVCMSTHLVWRQKQWSRMILATLFHANDMHLYFNMVSLMWKGAMLERRFRSQYFAYLLAVFTVLSSALYVVLNFILSEVLGDRSYELTCAVGFSGVIFALKVLTTHYSPAGFHYALGFIPVPSKYIYWAELGLIQLLHPQASLIGHLAGILVGLLYVKGPLKVVMDSFIPREPAYTYTANNTGYRQTRGQGYTTGGQGYTTGGQAPPYQEGPQGSYNTRGHGRDYEEYTGGMSEEEQTRQLMEDSQRQQSGSGERLYPDLDEIRRRRADRYT